MFTDELAQEPLGGATVTTALNQSVNDEAVLINGAPKPMLFAIDGDDDLIEMPLVAELGRASPDAIREFRPYFSAQRRTVSWLTIIPRAARRSSTTLRLNGNR